MRTFLEFIRIFLVFIRKKRIKCHCKRKKNYYFLKMQRKKQICGFEILQRQTPENLSDLEVETGEVSKPRTNNSH